MRKENVKVAFWGFGAMGQGMAKMILEKEGFLIVGVCDHDPELVGKDIFRVLGMDPYDHPRVEIQSQIEDVVTEQCCDVVLLSIESHATTLVPQVKWLLEKRVNIITTAEEFVYLNSTDPELVQELDVLAKKNGVTLLGTGITPGMMMDLLVLFLTGAMQDIDKITVKRVSSLSPFGKKTMKSRGIGQTVDDFHAKKETGEIVGHVGLKESTRMIAEGLGVSIESYREEMEPIITDVHRVSSYGFAEPGQVAGIHQTSQAICDDGSISLQLYLSQQLDPEAAGVLTGDYIYLEGDTTINMAIRPGVNGGSGTVAICVNMIPHVINANPGVKTMLDLPVPRAIVGDVRHMIEG